MIREVIGLTLVLLVFVVAWRVYRSVQRKKEEQQRHLPRPIASAGGADYGQVFYASTVFANSPLTRVWAHGLGGRGKAQLFLSADGISLERVGEPSLLIPNDDLHAMHRTSATIDKGVERDGLLALVWELGGQKLITNLRIVDPARRVEIETAITNLTGVKRG